MAKTKLNQTKRSEIKRIIKDYIQRTFNNDERFKELVKYEECLETLLQDKFNYFTNTTEEVINYLKSCNCYGQADVLNENYTFYQCNLSIDCLQAYCCKYEFESLKEKCSDFLNIEDCDYSCCIYPNTLMRKWLYNYEGWNNYNTQMCDLNNEYSEMKTKMWMIVDNCKYLEDVKEYIPIEEIISYVNQALYNCNTFISCITNEDLSLVKDFINNNKKEDN